VTPAPAWEAALAFAFTLAFALALGAPAAVPADQATQEENRGYICIYGVIYFWVV